jgi:phosphoribosylaminoimidazole-succinocarboxamide synthase
MARPATAVTTTALPLGDPVRGKVRDCYRHPGSRWGDALVIVSTDRISAFDWVLPSPIPDKGRVLTAISACWFDLLASGPDPIAHHLLTTDVDAEVIPFECVVRGWLAGSGLAEYRRDGTICGIPLPGGLAPGDPLPEPIFTPATKAASGHDENVSFRTMVAAIGAPLAERLRTRSLDVYRRATAHALARGIVIADTKFEWGHGGGGEMLLVDEVLTPDSSRFWPAAATGQGRVPESFDKQSVRDWLEGTGWDKASPPPSLPDDVVTRTRDTYLQICRTLTGGPPEGVA